ncbi:MAG: patatin-like phospholipase family protein [Candidatus Omnitrophica bacterium]|nr:patatin-like phospholipase family protein [Candidatus Omnitrophota bacterium]
MKKGIALSGGGAKSFSQIGVLKVLEKEGFTFDIITGTSMGAIIGTIYCFVGNAEKTEEIVIKVFSNKEFKKIEKIFSKTEETNSFKSIWKNIITFSLLLIDSFKIGLYDSEKIKRKIKSKKIIKSEFYFENLKKTLGIVATEYTTGKTIIFNKGEIIPALIASSAIPGLITPVEINNCLYVDGGVTSNLPVVANYLLGGEIIIGIENNSLFEKYKPKNTFDIFVHLEKIKTIYSGLFESLLSDFTINIELPDIEWFNFSKVKECIKIGEKYAQQSIKFVEEIFNKTEKSSFKQEIIEKIKDYFLIRESANI